MNHYVVFTLHDTNGRMTELLENNLQKIKSIFDKAIVSVTPATEVNKIDRFKDDNFICVNFNNKESQIGDHFVNGIKEASKLAKDEDIIHISTLDRLSFELERFEDEFRESMIKEKTDDCPILYLRSEKAWNTHPQNYRAIEAMGTELCERLIGKELDLFWCDLAMKNMVLKNILPTIETHDLRTWVELIWPIRKELIMKEVDWLAWEDPFIFNKDAAKYKKERENSEEENQKRLGYVIPAIEMVLEKCLM